MKYYAVLDTSILRLIHHLQEEWRVHFFQTDIFNEIGPYDDLNIMSAAAWASNYNHISAVCSGLSVLTGYR